jgi:hypothetical protein
VVLSLDFLGGDAAGPNNALGNGERETERHRCAVPHPMPPKGVGFPDPLSGTLKVVLIVIAPKV